MLEFGIFAVTIVTALIYLAFVWLYPTAKKQTTIPGLQPSDPKEGNFPDIKKAGSLHEFLLATHKIHGPIVSFWMGEELTVSISTPELFSEHMALFDRPPKIFEAFEPLIGSKSVQFANGIDGRKRRKLYDRCYSFQEISALYGRLNESISEIVEKWKKKMSEDQHISISNDVTMFTVKSVTEGSFGELRDEKAILDFKKSYDTVWAGVGHTAVPPAPGSEEEKRFNEAIQGLRAEMIDIIDHRRNNPPTDGRKLLIDVLLESYVDEELILSDALTFFIGGFHTTANSLKWTLYFLATHHDVQEKLFKELVNKIGKNEDVPPDLIKQVPYLQQVIDESLRFAVIGPYAARYVQDKDTMLGGFVVPKGTSVIHALGVCFSNDQLYPEPDKFDPDRFSPENIKSRPAHAFEPFGFAGKRKCPGWRLAYAENYVFLSRIIREFEIKMVPGQEITPVYGLVTMPNKEICVTLRNRME